jgi:hypothetical protein
VRQVRSTHLLSTFVANPPIRSLFLACLSLACFLTLTASAHAATYTITPSDSLITAASNLQPGDTLYLRQGTYNEGIDYATMKIPSGTSWSNAITIAGYPGERVTISHLSIKDDGYNVGSIPAYLIFNNLTIGPTRGNVR